MFSALTVDVGDGDRDRGLRDVATVSHSHLEAVAVPPLAVQGLCDVQGPVLVDRELAPGGTNKPNKYYILLFFIIKKSIKYFLQKNYNKEK